MRIEGSHTAEFHKKTYKAKIYVYLLPLSSFPLFKIIDFSVIGLNYLIDNFLL